LKRFRKIKRKLQYKMDSYIFAKIAGFEASAGHTTNDKKMANRYTHN